MSRTLALLGAVTLIALPASAALHNTPPKYGQVILTVDTHFALADQDKSDTLSLGEYVAVSHKMKEQAADEARMDFIAMDMNDDGLVSLDEFYGEMPSDLTV